MILRRVFNMFRAKGAILRRVYGIFDMWAQIWPGWASKTSFSASGRPGSRYGQNEPQRHHFEHLGGLAPDMARMSLRGIILSIWAAWPQIWPDRASEGVYILALGPLSRNA